MCDTLIAAAEVTKNTTAIFAKNSDRPPNEAQHLAWFPAQWPETYSYTLSACLRARLPVVAPDIGAFGERMRGREWTWIMMDDSPSGNTSDGSNNAYDYEGTQRPCGVGQSTPFAFQYVYSVTAGTHTYYLKGCSETTADGDGNLSYHPMIGIFVPTRY